MTMFPSGSTGRSRSKEGTPTESEASLGRCTRIWLSVIGYYCFSPQQAFLARVQHKEYMHAAPMLVFAGSTQA